jgi:hypothetical protein
MKKFKKSLELNKQFVNNISPDKLESLMSEFDKYDTDVQLMQTVVIGRSEQLCKCPIEYQVYNDMEGLNICTLCGKSKLA